MKGALLATLITAVSALIGTGALGLSQYRAAKRNTETTREVESDKLSLASWSALVAAGQKDVTDQRALRAEDRRDYGVKLEEYEAKLNTCLGRVEELATQIAGLSGEKDALLMWARRVVSIMRDHGIAFPTPPPGVTPLDMQAVDPT